MKSHHNENQDSRGNPENLDPRFSSVAHALKGINLPQDKEGLKSYAQDNNANDDVMTILENMPDREYRTMADVISESGSQTGHNRRN